MLREEEVDSHGTACNGLCNETVGIEVILGSCAGPNGAIVLQPLIVIFDADRACPGRFCWAERDRRASIQCLCRTTETPRWPQLTA
jgi:hypothetical protein